MSDDGPPFSAATFSKFAKEWGFTHLTSSPHNPQSHWKLSLDPEKLTPKWPEKEQLRKTELE